MADLNQAANCSPEQKKKALALRAACSRVGLAVLVTVLCWEAASFFFGPVLADWLGDRWTLYLNEIFLALGIGAGVLSLIGTSAEAPERQKMPFGRWLLLLLMCFGMAFVGNLLGILATFLWDTVTGGNGAGDVSALLSETDTLQTLLTAGIAAPILEEFLCRKLVLDRTLRYGEKPAIFLSAFLFALLHMNLGQVFYAFGIGLICGYLYARSGKLWLCILTHMSFNLISGVSASLFVKKLSFLFAEGNPAPEQIVEHLGTLLLFILYALFVFGLDVAGIALFCVRAPKYRPRPTADEVQGKAAWRAMLLNVGTLAAIAVLLGFAIWSMLAR